LYTREIRPAPDSPVKDGIPRFGTYSGPFEKMDIRGMPRPFGDIPFPALLTNLRIMETVRFMFCDDANIGEIELFNAGYFSFMEATLWNRNTRRRIAYRRVFFPGLRHMVRNFQNAVLTCRSPQRFVRIHGRLNRRHVHVDFDFQGSGSRPPCHGRLEMNLEEKSTADLSSVLPYGVKRRCLASYQLTAPLQGWIGTGYEDYRISFGTGVGFYDVRKAYFSTRTKINKLVGLGYLDGRLVSFQFGNSVNHDETRYNDNVLFYDGTAYPMPPVKITRPFGIGGDWIIQDTESMVDLAFTLVSDNARKMSVFLFRTDYHTVYGKFNGMLLLGSGESLSLKSFPGIGKKIVLRV